MIVTAVLILTMNMTETRASNERKLDDVRCGIYCLTAAAKALGQKVDQKSIEELLGEPEMNGYSMEKLSSAAQSLGLSTRMSKTTLDQLRYRYDAIGERFVCVTLINDDHFVLLTEVEGKVVSVCDPPRAYSLDSHIFERLWGGQVLLISTSPLVHEESVLASNIRRHVASRIGLGLMTSVVVLGILFSINRIRGKRKVKCDA